MKWWLVVCVALWSIVSPRVHADDGGTLQLTNNGIFEAYLSVDGTAVGRLKRNIENSFPLTTGTHRLVVTDKGGQVSICLGDVAIKPSEVSKVVVNTVGCTGLQGQVSGALGSQGKLQLRSARTTPTWASLDGGTPRVLDATMWEEPLAVGTHTLVVANDATLTDSVCRGTFATGSGAVSTISVDNQGCLGLGDAPTAPSAAPSSSDGSLGNSTTAPDQECKMGSDGRNVCGYNCEMGSNGRVYCSDLPNGKCALNSDGTWTCPSSSVRGGAGGLGQRAAVGTAQATEPQECKMGSDGRNVCGYNCKLGSNGRVYCATTPNGKCALNSNGTWTCP